MAHYNVHVPTEELAASLYRISSSVSDVEESVFKMTESLVDAEEKAAENISSNVTYGFYMLTRNQFLQKAIMLENEATTSYIKIETYYKNLLAIKERMEKDYASISAQYLRIFREIDGNLKKAFLDLDKALLEIAELDSTHLRERRVDGSMKGSSYPDTIIPASEALVASALKNSAKDIQKALFHYLQAQNDLNLKLSSSLDSESVEDGGRDLYYPLIIMEKESEGMENTYLTEVLGPSSMQDASISLSAIELKNDDKYWDEASDVTRTLVHKELKKLLEKEDKRKAELILKLFEESKWKETRGI